MGLVETATLLLTCVLARADVSTCLNTYQADAELTSAVVREPQHTGASFDVVLTAQAALVWDINTGAVLYEKNSHQRRPVASLSKLLSVLTVKDMLPLSKIVEIPSEAGVAQRKGANIKLPVGQHATVQDLLAASLIPSANDAAVTLAVATAGSEEAFVALANSHAEALELTDTKLANATGLSGGDQYSTARDIMRALLLIYEDPQLRSYLSAQAGTLHTTEGAARAYKTTDKLLGTYLPILAAKTGYTVEAGQNLAIITQDKAGHTIGAVVLGSDDRFQDMKVLVEWIWRNYTW